MKRWWKQLYNHEAKKKWLTKDHKCVNLLNVWNLKKTMNWEFQGVFLFLQAKQFLFSIVSPNKPKDHEHEQNHIRRWQRQLWCSQSSRRKYQPWIAQVSLLTLTWSSFTLLASCLHINKQLTWMRPHQIFKKKMLPRHLKTMNFIKFTKLKSTPKDHKQNHKFMKINLDIFFIKKPIKGLVMV
jgi:hypothetical protein